MKEYYGVTDLRPDIYPIKTYDDINKDCSGMYNGSNVLESEEHFAGGGLSMPGQNIVLWFLLCIMFVWFILPHLKLF
jgi:hypothetical protein